MKTPELTESQQAKADSPIGRTERTRREQAALDKALAVAVALGAFGAYDTCQRGFSYLGTLFMTPLVILIALSVGIGFRKVFDRPTKRRP